MYWDHPRSGFNLSLLLRERGFSEYLPWSISYKIKGNRSIRGSIKEKEILDALRFDRILTLKDQKELNETLFRAQWPRGSRSNINLSPDLEPYRKTQKTGGLIANFLFWIEREGVVVLDWEAEAVKEKDSFLISSVLQSWSIGSWRPWSRSKEKAFGRGRGEREAGPLTANRSITQSQAVPSLSDFLLSDHTRNYVSTYRIFAPPR